MSDHNVIDLSKPTGWFEVAVFHFADGRYSVDTDRGLGRLTAYEADSEDKALGVAEYLESVGRIRMAARWAVGEAFTRDGSPAAADVLAEGLRLAYHSEATADFLTDVVNIYLAAMNGTLAGPSGPQLRD